MTSFIRSAIVLGLVTLTAGIAPIARAETETIAREGSEIVNSEAIESSENLTDRTEEDNVIVAEVKGESTEVSAGEAPSTLNRTPLTSRIFPCSSMQQ